MRGHLPILRPREVVRALERSGRYSHRQKGSHLIIHKPGSRNVVVIPLHDRDVPAGTLKCILSDAELTVEEFTALLD